MEPMIFVAALILVAVMGLILGGLPGGIAERRGHLNTKAIRLCG